MTEQTIPVEKLRDLLDGEGSVADKIQAIYDLLPDPPLPDPLFLAKATHPEYGEGVVSSHFPVMDGTVRFMFPGDAFGDGTNSRWVDTSTLTFHTQDHPVLLETEEDYRSAPEGTIVLVDALPGEGAWTKTAPGEWAGTPSFMVWCDRYMGAVPSRVIRWGRGE